jgi:hypothetical protein
MSAIRVIPNVLNQSLTTFKLPPRLLFQVQKEVTPPVPWWENSSRKFVNDEVHLSDEKVDNP